jgi:hypothetical protein
LTVWARLLDSPIPNASLVFQVKIFDSAVLAPMTPMTYRNEVHRIVVLVIMIFMMDEKSIGKPLSFSTIPLEKYATSTTGMWSFSNGVVQDVSMKKNDPQSIAQRMISIDDDLSSCHTRTP